MPNMTGIEFLRAVRSDDRFKEIPFIMLTTEGKKQDVIEAVNAGVSNYIVKPFNPDTLYDKIKKVL
jgi:two-component system chemotaxis response regulator CheY